MTTDTEWPDCKVHGSVRFDLIRGLTLQVHVWAILPTDLLTNGTRQKLTLQRVDFTGLQPDSSEHSGALKVH